MKATVTVAISYIKTLSIFTIFISSYLFNAQMTDTCTKHAHHIYCRWHEKDGSHFMFCTCTAVLTGYMCVRSGIGCSCSCGFAPVNFGIHLLACLSRATDTNPLALELLKLLHDNKVTLFCVLIIVFSSMCCSRFPFCWINVMNK